MGGPLFGFVAALLACLVVLGLVLFADIALRYLDVAKTEVAGALGVEPSEEYSKRAEEVVSALSYVVVAAIVFTAAVYSMYRGRR